MSETTAAMQAVADLAATFEGALLQPDDDGFDAARHVWNGMIDRRPVLIARCASTSDVVAAVNYARDTRLPLAVRGGGHSAVGYGTCDEGVVIDLSPLNSIEIDPVARTARVGGGCTWGELDPAAQEHGLAVTGGRFSTTGVAGLTLGSGSGWLERKCGLTADSLLSAEIVLADGSVVVAGPEDNPDLYWALRGGSGNFGVVTRFEYRLHEIGPIIYGGMLLALPERAGEILRCFRDLMAQAPDDLGGAVAFLSAPPEPFVPAERQFQPAVGIVICWTGEHGAGEEIVAPLREAAQPFVDLVQPMPYVALQSMLDASAPKGIRAYMKAEFLDDMGDEVIAKLIHHGAKRAGPMDQLLLEPMGGAIAHTADADTALGRRDAEWCYHALGLWVEPDAESDAAHVAWARELAADVAPHTSPGVYLNFTSDQGEEKVREAYGAERYERLAAVKAKYDPGNLFRINQNIAP
jgi:FAD/FMN-containing dehydrogenase